MYARFCRHGGDFGFDPCDNWLGQSCRTEQSERVQGVDAVAEAGIAGSGVVLATDVTEEIDRRTLVRILPDWDCTGIPPMVTIYRKTPCGSSDRDLRTLPRTGSEGLRMA